MCRVGGELSGAKRARLPAREFGLPAQRKYPIHDLSHARNAKARAAQQLNRGGLTRAEYREVARRADRVIKECGAVHAVLMNGNPGNPNGGRMHNPNNNPMSAAMRMWLWIGGAVVGVGAVGGLAYWATRKKEPDSKLPEAGMVPTPAVPVPVPIPPIPMMPDDEEPIALGEGEPVDAQMSGALMSHGVRVEPEDRRITVLDPDQWVAWAGPEVAAINVEQWPAVDIIDNVYAQAFPSLPGKLSELAGWSINGQPVADIVERGQTFLDGILSGDYVTPKNFPGHRAFAEIMAGQSYAPLRIGLTPPFNTETGWELYQREKPGFGLHHYLVRITKTTNPALGQTMFSWTWWVWPPDATLLAEGNAMKKGGKPQKDQSIAAAQDFIDSYATVQAQVA